MIRNYLPIITSLLLPLQLTASESNQTDQYSIGKLKLQQEVPLTDINGVIIPSTVAYAKVGDYVKLYRTDKFCYTGQVTEVLEADGYLKVFGTINNVKDANFGFVMAKGGNFAGAIVDKALQGAYVIEPSFEHKGYIFVYTLKYVKPII